MHDQLKDLRAIVSSRAFVILDYQRGYAWSDEHRKDLLADLDALDAKKKHFTGTLVLRRGRHELRTVRGRVIDVLEVVDGQQRLTTLVILLSVIARRLDALGTEASRDLARDLRETFIEFQRIPRLTPHGDAAQFFLDHVLGDLANAAPSSPPARALLAARTQFESFVDAKLQAAADVDARLAWLERWTALITSRLGFLLFEVEDEADVGVMFEAMNARGKPLTQFELVKNYLLFAAAKVTRDEPLARLVAEVNRTWTEVVRTLDAAGISDADDTFLRTHWWIWPHAKGLDGESLWKTHNIHRAVKATIPVADGEDRVVARIHDYLQDLRLAVPAFAALLRPTWRGAFAFAGTSQETLREAALGVSRLGRRAVVLPMLMASVLAFGSDPPALAEILRRTEVFVFRLSLRGMKSNTGESSLMQLAHAIRTTPTTAAVVQQRLRDLIGYYAPDAVVERALLERDGSTPEGNFYERGVLPHLLFEYERSLVAAAKQKFPLDWDAFYKVWRESTEHILPQGDATLSVPYWSQRFTQDGLRRNRHRLGNLVLTDWNSHYGNRGFDQKCGAPGCATDARVYRNSRFYSERELVNEPAWDEAAIDRRQQRIARFAMLRWAV